MDAVAGALDAGALQDHAGLDFGVAQVAVVVDGGVRADVGVDDLRVLADDCRPVNRAVDHARSGLQDDAALERRALDRGALRAGFEVIEDEPVRFEQVVELTGVDPTLAHDLGADVGARVHQPLDRVRDLELAPR